MNMHPGGPGQPHPGPHHYPLQHHPHQHPYSVDPNQPFPLSGVQHLHGVPQPHDGHPGEDNVGESMHDHDDSDGQHGGEAGLEAPPKRKRRRQALSCTECKRRKIKCDRENPCSPCVRRGESDRCQWHVLEPMEKYVTRSEYDELKRKFDALEHTVAQFAGRPPGGIYPMGAPWGMPPIGDVDGGNPTARSSSVVVDPNLQPAASTTTTNANQSAESKKRGAQTLSGVEKGERLRPPVFPQPIPMPPILPFQHPAYPIPMHMMVHPPPPGSTLVPAAPTGIPIPIPPPMRALPILPNLHPDNWSQLGAASNPGLDLGLGAAIVNSKPGVTGSGLPPYPTPIPLSNGYWTHGLPPRNVCDIIVNYYFLYVSWSHAVVLRNRMESRIKTFWSVPNGEASSAWVALYFLILYHGVSNMDPEDETNLTVLSTKNEWRRLCQTFWHGAQFALAQTDLAASKELEIIQALILLASVYLSLDKTGWQAFAPTLAYTIRLAQNMELSNIPPETSDAEPKPGLRERELKRRLWWTLVIFDWQYASHLHYVYCIHPSQFDTGLPGNFDIDELDDHALYKEFPSDRPTSASLLLAKASIAQITRKLYDSKLRDGDIDFKALLDYNEDVTTVFQRLPNFLLTKQEVLEGQLPFAMWQRTAFLIGMHSSTITLYRPWFIVDDPEDKYIHARTKCLSSAEKILSSMKELEVARFPGRRWWGYLLQCYKACIVLLIDHQRKQVGSVLAPLAESTLAPIKTILSLLRDTTDVIALAKKASLVLQHFLDEAGASVHAVHEPAGRHNLSKRDRESNQDVSNHNKVSYLAANPWCWEKVLELDLEVEFGESASITQMDPPAKTSSSSDKPAGVERGRGMRSGVGSSVQSQDDPGWKRSE